MLRQSFGLLPATNFILRTGRVVGHVEPACLKCLPRTIKCHHKLMNRLRIPLAHQTVLPTPRRSSRRPWMQSQPRSIRPLWALPCPDPLQLRYFNLFLFFINCFYVMFAHQICILSAHDAGSLYSLPPVALKNFGFVQSAAALIQQLPHALAAPSVNKSDQVRSRQTNLPLM